MTKSDYALCGVVQKLDLFRDLDLDDAQLILNISAPRDYAKDETIWSAGDPSPYLLIILGGRVEMCDTHGNAVADLEAGSTLGEMSCLTGHPRFRSVTVLEPVTALALDRHDLLKLAEDRPSIYRKVLENALDILAHRLSKTEHFDSRRRRPQPVRKSTIDTRPTLAA